MTRRPSSQYPFPVPKDTMPASSGQYEAISQEQHTLSQEPPSQALRDVPPTRVIHDPPTHPVRDRPPVIRVTRAHPVASFPQTPVPPTIQLDRPQFQRPPTQYTHATMPHYAMIPSFTGTTVTEAMRYEKPFLIRVLQSFVRNNAVLMAGGVAYNMLLSIIPMFALVFVGLSQFFDKDLLLQTLNTNLQLLAPGGGPFIRTQLSYFLEHREVFGGITLVLLVFFSTLAFKTLESTMSVIFAYDRHRARRRFWVSATIPYLYIICIFVGIVMLTGLNTMLGKSTIQQFSILGFTWSVGSANNTILHLASFLGLGMMLASLYMVMPKCPISLRRALAGGFVAATLWELTRFVLVWYFTKISLVSAIYGPLGTVIVVLLSFEVAAIIVLLGAQVIAELQRSEIYRNMVKNGDLSALPTH